MKTLTTLGAYWRWSFCRHGSQAECQAARRYLPPHEPRRPACADLPITGSDLRTGAAVAESRERMEEVFRQGELFPETGLTESGDKNTLPETQGLAGTASQSRDAEGS